MAETFLALSMVFLESHINDSATPSFSRHEEESKVSGFFIAANLKNCSSLNYSTNDLQFSASLYGCWSSILETVTQLMLLLSSNSLIMQVRVPILESAPHDLPASRQLSQVSLFTHLRYFELKWMVPTGLFYTSKNISAFLVLSQL